jgi:hypothetical protein
MEQQTGIFEKFVTFLSPIGVCLAAMNTLAAFLASAWFMFAFHAVALGMFILYAKKLWEMVRDNG